MGKNISSPSVSPPMIPSFYRWVSQMAGSTFLSGVARVMGYAQRGPYFLLDSPLAGPTAWEEAAASETPGHFSL